MARKPRIDWELYRTEITDLYLHGKPKPYTKRQLLGFLNADPHRLNITINSVETGLRKLGLKKNVTASQWKAIGSEITKRKREEGKESQVDYNGSIKPSKKVQRAIRRCGDYKLQDQEHLLGVLLKTPPSSPRVSSQQSGLDFIERQPKFENPQYLDLGVMLPNEQTYEVYMDFEPQSVSFPFWDSELALPLVNDHTATQLHAAQNLFSAGTGTFAPDKLSWPAIQRDVLLSNIPSVQAMGELFSNPGLRGFIRSWAGRVSQALDQANSRGSYSNMSTSKLLCNSPTDLLSDALNACNLFKNPGIDNNGIVIEASKPNMILLSLIYQISNNKLNTQELQYLLSLLKDGNSAETVSIFFRKLFDSKNASAKQIAFEIFNQAVRSGDAKFVRKLLHLGADPEPLQGKSGGQLLTQAILNSHLDMAHLLLDHGADANCEDESQHYGAIKILFISNNWSISKKRTMFRRLISKGADIEGALDVAIFWKNDIELVKILLENGANPEDVYCREDDQPDDEATPPSDDIIRLVISHLGPKWNWLKLRGIIIAARDSVDSVQNFLSNLEVSKTEEWQLLAEALNICVDERSYWGRISSESYTSESECSDYEPSRNFAKADSPYGEIGLRDRATDRSAIENLLKAGADPNYVEEPLPDGIEPMLRFLMQRKCRLSTLVYAIESHHRQDRVWKTNILIKHGGDFSKPGLFESAVSLGYLDLTQ